MLYDYIGGAIGGASQQGQAYNVDYQAQQQAYPAQYQAAWQQKHDIARLFEATPHSFMEIFEKPKPKRRKSIMRTFIITLFILGLCLEALVYIPKFLNIAVKTLSEVKPPQQEVVFVNPLPALLK